MLCHMDRSKYEIHVYLPFRLWEQLKKMAERNRRSVSAETVIAIEERVKSDKKDKR